MNRFVKICLVVALAAAPVAAQQTQAPPTVPPATTPVPPGSPGQTPPPARGQGRGTLPPTTTPTTIPPPGQAPAFQNPPRAEPPSSWQNVRIDIVVGDSGTTESQNRKSVSMLVLDGRSGSIRSLGANSAFINVDATPTIRPDGRIYLRVTFEYKVDPSGQPPQGASINVSESLYLVVPDGKAVVASQAADPRSDRKVTVEITATVQK